MMHYKKTLIITGAMASLLVLGFYINHVMSTYALTTQRIDVKSDKKVPAGVLKKGDIIVQPFILDKAINKGVCVEILFATYKRINNGIAEVAIEQGGNRWSTQIKTELLQDNEYKHFCYSDAFLQEGGANIEIEILENNDEKGITLWLGKETGTQTITKNGVPSDNSLIYRLLEVKQPPRSMHRYAYRYEWVFFVFLMPYFVSVPIIFLIIMYASKDQ